MNTKKQLNNILNKFPKTELEKVELSYTQELRSMVKTIIRNNEKAEKELANLKNFIRSNAKSVVGYSNENFRIFDETLRTYKKFEAEAKKLGLEVPSEYKKIVVQASDESSKTNKISFEASKILKSIN